MAQYYLQVEAVNLAHTVYDTHDISTIRGGSFVLLDVIRRLAEHFADRLVRITTAASQGLFALKEQTNPDSIEADMLFFLQRETNGHATFVVAIEPEIPNDFTGVLERLQAQIRRKQWRMPTVTIPEVGKAQEECFLDGWRPGTIAYWVEGRVARKISATTKFRRDAGVRLKHQLLERILREPTDDDALNARDLGELATHSKMGVLNGKIAYIHVDGNSFGRIRRAVCTTPETRRAFDEQIQTGCREPFLRELLNRINRDTDFLTQDANGQQARRLEVLVWGGDEMTLIVPAWRGWQVLELFYQYARNLTFEGVELSHRAAIVFCHHNTPILQIRRIAEELLAEARSNIKKRATAAVQNDVALSGVDERKRKQVTEWLANHRYGNAIHYLALESFDMLRGSLSAFLRVYYRKPLFDKMLLYADEMRVMLDDLQLLQATLARGKVLKVIDALQKEYLFSFTPPHVDEVEAIPNPRRSGIDGVVASLNNGEIPATLRDQFQTQLSIALPAAGAVTMNENGSKWTIAMVNQSYVIYRQERTLHIYVLRNEKDLAALGDDVLGTVEPRRAAQVRTSLARVLTVDQDHWYWIADLWDYVPEWKV